MHRQIFVNLPVKDLQRSVAFFGALGFMYGHGFTDPDGHVWELVHMVDASQAVHNT